MLEGQECHLQASEIGEVAGGEHFPLDDREVDLNLVQPTGVNRGVDRDEGRPAGLQALIGFLPAVRGAVVEDPEHPAGRAVGFLPITSSTKPSNGAIPVLASQRLKILARWTSQAAK